MPTKAATINLNPQAGRRPIDTRGSAASRGYDATWQKFRRWYASTTPAICASCGLAGASRLMHLDHITPLSEGGARLDAGNVQWLCQSCHNAKTAADGQRRG